ncbi:TPA: type II toxin-antitoxin system antitoxin, RelB/DinJ family, partial [Enterococcus faecium]|nr:type II toxin-antitoxin system antitoxin, RelB/DinJ family [Enterococcus faecium]
VFYKQIVEQGKIPFSIELSEKSKRIHNIQRLAEKLPVQKLDTDEKIEEWFNEDEY